MTTSILTITNPSQLAEFCAVIIPCIWAGSFKSIISSPKRHLTFKLYVQKVLKATQISCTCMILALYYIQKLRAAYPSIHASIGSEVRLFTTALVLANKYLDDNTFTNKTWSEVSSISISELNIMEMEFLSALDYHLHLPQDEFYSWVNQCQQWCISLLPPSPSPPPVSMKRTYDTLDEQPHMSKKRWMDYNVCKPILSWSSSIPIVQPDFTQYYTNPYSTPTTPANTNYYLPFVNQQWF
ncbi:cyclin-domain-containing protein [Gilbertella persicaria]|uniref:cyclin-domain-containing protein n=1 Tax=Gilbertella persicaria TaxID=101096 RepID=UPI0022200E74|nr:cyclin-domain-containing protein [Gilbertella persicaria]KAI8077918.1 cyclin-domain-containing protein [Gilbertella persicaria]